MTNLVSEYYSWLQDNTFFESIENNIARISLPFLNRNNDYTEIYIRQNSDNYFTLTDDGETLSELELSGLKITPKRKELIDNILFSFGINSDKNNCIWIDADKSNLFLKKHMLVQCMMEINDLFNLQDSNVKSLFLDDVAEYLDSNDIRYVNNIMLVGKSKLPCHFDFAIPKSNKAPERIIKAINNFDNNAAKLLMFNWEDSRANRSPDSVLFAFINKIDKESKQTALSGLGEYGIRAVKWTARDQVLSSLVS